MRVPSKQPPGAVTDCEWLSWFTLGAVNGLGILLLAWLICGDRQEIHGQRRTTRRWRKVTVAALVSRIETERNESEGRVDDG